VTHTLHRRGSIQSLSDDYIVQIAISKQAERSKSVHNPSLSSSVMKAAGKAIDKYFTRFPYVKEQIQKIVLELPIAPNFIKKYENRIIRYFVPSLTVFNTKTEFTRNLLKLKKIDLGSSVVVSGLFENIDECLKEISICPHTVQYSLGVFGKVDRLPEEKILEITSMCGHHLISPRLVKDLIKEVKADKRTPESAAELLGRQCICGAFNKARAVKLIQAY
jgi:hypothetical protein